MIVITAAGRLDTAVQKSLTSEEKDHHVHQQLCQSYLEVARCLVSGW